MSCPDAHGGFGSPFMPAEGHGSPMTHGTIREDRGKNNFVNYPNQELTVNIWGNRKCKVGLCQPMDFGRISHPCSSEINSISEPLKSLEQKAQNMPYVGDAEMTSDGRSSFLGTEAVGSLSAFSFLISALPADTEGRKRKFENSGLNHIPLSSVLPTVVNYRKIISV